MSLGLLPARDAMPRSGPLVDRLGRVHTSLRISVTDRCNIRCFYCMPAERVEFRPRNELLTFEEIAEVVRVVAALGVNKLRLTGGEPLVRNGVARLVRMLHEVPGVEQIALTTNGLLLADQAQGLKAAGLTRLNVSLDTLDEAKFLEISRREGLDRVLGGLRAAREAGFDDIKLNALAIRQVTEDEIVPLARFARAEGFELRFIEYMPLDADDAWEASRVLPGREILARLEAEIGPLEPIGRDDPAQPATDYRFADGGGTLGLINPVSEPFCGACNRLRITAEGRFRNCLFSTTEWDARAILRDAAAHDRAARLEQLVRECVWHKQPAHGIASETFVKPERAMYQIGG